MSEYQVKFKVITGNLLPPYSFDGVEVYEAENGKQAIEMVKADYRAKVPLYADECPLQITEVIKL